MARRSSEMMREEVGVCRLSLRSDSEMEMAVSQPLLTRFSRVDTRVVDWGSAWSDARRSWRKKRNVVPGLLLEVYVKLMGALTCEEAPVLKAEGWKKSFSCDL